METEKIKFSVIAIAVLLLATGLSGCTGEAKDTDGDGYNDDVDTFPNDPSEWKDSDHDGVGDNSDDFPNDRSEWKDSDNDGVGDNSDAFPNNRNEQYDSDEDGIGNNADAFPYDSTEWKDSDNDGVGDNSDAFPNNPNEQYDSDRDGVGDNADDFPNDSTQTVDRDGDGYGDNPNGNDPDVFPDDGSEWKDSDNDGIGNNADIYDYGNGGIRVKILNYKGDGYPDKDEQNGVIDPYFIIRISVTDPIEEWKTVGTKESRVFYNRITIINPLILTVDIDDDIDHVAVSIYGYDKDTYGNDDIIDLSGDLTYPTSKSTYKHINPRITSYVSITDDGRLDLLDEMDGYIEYCIEVIEV